MKLFYTLLLCISLNTIFAQVPTSERNALIDFYNATNGNNWVDNTNWNTANPVSTWLGVTTTVISGQERVTGLSFSDNRLVPNIPSSIGNLTELVAFFVINPFNYYGSSNSIPSEIGQLTKLEFFWIENWNIEGTIPSELSNINGSGGITIRGTNIGGNIPNSLTTMPNLTALSLNGNNFSGIIPDFTSTGLDFFRIQDNAFQFGDFENEHASYVATIGSYTFAPQAFVDTQQNIALDNGESHTFTTNVSGSNNTYFWFKDNVNTGITGSSFTVTINSVADYGVYLYIAINSVITGLQLQSQNFVIGEPALNHPDYNALIAVYNAFDGPNWTTTWNLNAPIHSWQGLTFDPVTDRVTGFNLNGNNLTGIIPPEIGDLTELDNLWLFEENISGEIPAEIWTLTNLKNLVIGSQQSSSAYHPGNMTLTNGIPAEISNLQQLEWLNLNGVLLTQPLQPELFNLPNLIRIRFQDCGITGTLPVEFANINDLRIGRNEFEGAIPQEILDSTGNNLISLTGNFFDFSDLEPLVIANNYNFITYSPQRTRDIEEDVTSAPGSDITLNVDDTDIGRTVTVTNAVNNEYQWYKDNVAISGATQNFYTIFNAQVADNGIYFCEITNTLLPDLIIRRANINVLVDPSASTNNYLLDNVIIYPNPAQDFLNIKLNNRNNENLVTTIYDITGRLVLKKNINSNLAQINLNNLSSGVYLLKIKSKKTFITKQIIKK